MTMETRVSSPLEMSVSIDHFPINGSFIIARGAKTEAVVVTVSLRTKSGEVGRGECVPYKRYNETPEGVRDAIESVRIEIERGLSRQKLQTVMPLGAARNAVDCALWDLEAKVNKTSSVKMAGFTKLEPVTTAYTISLESPEKMFQAAKKASARPLLKIKLGAEGGDFERIHAVRSGAPKSELIADANEGWTRENLVAHLEACRAAGFSLIEQPLPQAQDEILKDYRGIVALCADESVHARESLDRLVGLYDFVNIKLDKTGGLTEALKLGQAARDHGLGIMVGCMVGTSLGMAPAMMLSPWAKFIDLDGPLLLAKDRETALRYEGSLLYPPDAALWG